MNEDDDDDTPKIDDDDKDTVLFPLVRYWFTFGYGHHMGPGRIPLRNCYTIIQAVSEEDAAKMMYGKRDLKWATHYDNPISCGVDRHGLQFIPFEKLQLQEGNNL